MRISLIAALARNRVIGGNGKIPWHLPEDLKRFKALTLGHPIIMGRKTFDSLGRPLPGRRNIVITRQADFRAEGVSVVGSLEAALADCPRETDEAFVIGGADIYRLALPRADRLYLTLLDREFPGDVRFPEWPADEFAEIAREERELTSPDAPPLTYRYVVLERRGRSN